MGIYSFSHNLGSWKWVPPRLVSFPKGSCSTSMTMGERVEPSTLLKKFNMLIIRLNLTLKWTPITHTFLSVKILMSYFGNKCPDFNQYASIGAHTKQYILCCVIYPAANGVFSHSETHTANDSTNIPTTKTQRKNKNNKKPNHAVGTLLFKC